jgi:uncharacterized iron-regulated membrane protein
MKDTFRQSMTWLHTWAGLLVGWVLFFVFVTGTFGYVNSEVTRWMKPELPMVPPPASALLTIAEQWLEREAPEAANWYMSFPADRGGSELSVGWRAQPHDGEKLGKFTQVTLDPRTGEIGSSGARKTGGGSTLYLMHYRLQYMPYEWAIRIVGVCTMFMLVAILSGVVAHKKIFKNFFTFRPAKGQQSWLDGHTLLAASALPFHLMITWSGMIFFASIYMPIAIDALYPEGPARDYFNMEAYGEERSEGEGTSTESLTPIAPLLAQAEREWGAGKVGRIDVDAPGRDNARISIYSNTTNGLNRLGDVLRFDGVSGVRLASAWERATPASKFNSILLGLHEGRFAGPLLRTIYVVVSLAGTAMVATGLLLWSTKRKAKLRTTAKPHFGIAMVDILNLGTIIGLPIGIAAYFWANRLLPVEMPGRAGWEVHVMFITWTLTFLYAAIRPLNRAWRELCWIAAVACALLPMLNALTTDRHLGVSIASGDWIFAGFDLSSLAAGVFFALVAYLLTRKYRTAASLRAAIPATRIEREAAE